MYTLDTFVFCLLARAFGKAGTHSGADLIGARDAYPKSS
jgi:hypothetical protein